MCRGYTPGYRRIIKIMLAYMLPLVVMLWMQVRYHNPPGIAVSLTVMSVWLAVVVMTQLIFRRHVLARDSTLTRAVFNDFPNTRPIKVLNHSHGEMAANRNLGGHIIEAYSEAIGCFVFMYQLSYRQQERGVPGSNEPHWPEDWHKEVVPFRPDSMRPDTVIGIVDTEWYMPLNRLIELLHSTSSPILICTFSPQAAASGVGEYLYYFDADQVCHTQVSGGAKYQHRLWDWSSDLIYTEQAGVTTVYNVDRKQLGTSKHHVLICLSPMVRYSGWAPYEVERGAPLARLAPVQDGVVTLRVQSTEGLVVSLARVGAMTSVDLPVASYDAALAMQALQGTKLSAGMLASAIRGIGKDNITENQAAMLADILKTSSKRVVCHITAPPPHFHRFQNGHVFDPDATPGMVAFMSPLVAGAVVHDQTPENMAAAIRGRVEDTHHENYGVSGTTLRKLKDFVDLIFEGAPKCRRMQKEDMYDKRSRPTQRALDNAAQFANKPKVGVKPHLKGESYPTAGDGRVITTFDSTVSLDYGCYVAGLAPMLRRQRWYSPGMTPLEIADSVVRICRGAKANTGTDFERMDGHVHVVGRLLWQMIMMRAYPEDAARVGELLRAHMAQMGKSSAGKYFTWLTRCSGGFDTTDANSSITGFVCWDSLVESGFDPKLAFEKFIVCGDDALVGHDVSGVIEKSAKSIDMVVESIVTPAGKAGTNFVNRIYGPGLHFGDGNSMTDVSRAMLKFHLTAGMAPGVSDEDKARDKAYAYLFGDANTPIVGPFCRKLLHVLGAPLPEKRLGLGPYGAVYDTDQQYPNEFADWMLTVTHALLPDFDYVQFENWLAFATPSSVLQAPCCSVSLPVVKRTGWLDGRLVSGKPYKQDQSGKWADWDYVHRRFTEFTKEYKVRIEESKLVADAITELTGPALDAAARAGRLDLIPGVEQVEFDPETESTLPAPLRPAAVQNYDTAVLAEVGLKPTTSNKAWAEKHPFLLDGDLGDGTVDKAAVRPLPRREYSAHKEVLSVETVVTGRGAQPAPPPAARVAAAAAPPAAKMSRKQRRKARDQK